MNDNISLRIVYSVVFTCVFVGTPVRTGICKCNDVYVVSKRCNGSNILPASYNRKRLAFQKYFKVCVVCVCTSVSVEKVE